MLSSERRVVNEVRHIPFRLEHLPCAGAGSQLSLSTGDAPGTKYSESNTDPFEQAWWPRMSGCLFGLID